MGYKQKIASKQRTESANGSIERQPKSEMVLTGRNFLYMAIAGVMIIVGFLLMAGPSATVEQFEPDIFSTRRIVVGPMIAFLGFVAMAVAIMLGGHRKHKAD